MIHVDLRPVSFADNVSPCLFWHTVCNPLEGDCVKTSPNQLKNNNIK